MPLDGGGTASKPAGTTAAPNTTIGSAAYNSTVDDIYNIFNTPRPVAYGGTGASNAADARANLGLTTMPRFSAAKSVQQAGIGNATVTFPTEIFDIGGYYNTATSRWTPPAGTYKIGARVLVSGSIAAGTSYTLSIYKNGGATIFARNQIRAASAGGFSILVEDLVESNGTDTWEINLQSGGASINVEGGYSVSAFYGFAV